MKAALKASMIQCTVQRPITDYFITPKLKKQLEYCPVAPSLSITSSILDEVIEDRAAIENSVVVQSIMTTQK